MCGPREERRRKAAPTRKNSERRCGHRVGIEEDSEGAEEACGKLILVCNGVLTYSERVLILVSSLEATLLDRGVEQTLFDNLIDVPESVRPHSSPSSMNGSLSNLSD
jgi:hypothetical protein